MQVLQDLVVSHRNVPAKQFGMQVGGLQPTQFRLKTPSAAFLVEMCVP